MKDKIFIVSTGDKPVKIAYEDRPILDEATYLKAIENLINNIGGHLYETLFISDN